MADLWDWAVDAIKGIDAGDVLNAGVNIGGALLSNSATNKAIDTQTAAGDKALALQQRMYEDSQRQLAPYQATGTAANAKLSQLMGLAPADTSAIKANLLKAHPALFGGMGAAANPSDIYAASGDVLSGVQGINSGGYKYNQADFQRIMDAAGQNGYNDYTREDVINAAQRLADPNSQTKAADSQFLVDKFNRIHSQFDPRPKKKKWGFGSIVKLAIPAAVGLGVGAAIPGIGGAVLGKGASEASKKLVG